MSKPTISNKSIENIQDHLMSSNIDWFSTETRSREWREFRTNPSNGMSLIHGGLRADPSSLTGMIWCRFNDLDGMTHLVEFHPYFSPQDCRQVAVQCYMRLNEIRGLSPWNNLKTVRDAHINRVYEGRLPERD